MNKFELLLAELQVILQNLEDKFINPFLIPDEFSRKWKDNPKFNSDDYLLDVNAYVVLCHSAFEEFFEKIAMERMKIAKAEWENGRVVTNVLLLQIAYYYSYRSDNERIMHLEQDFRNNRRDINDISRFDFHLENIVKKASGHFGKTIQNNHGVGIDYLLHLLIPVGINICQDPDLMSALNSLKIFRGEAAHSQGLSKSLSPSNAKEITFNCLLLCKDVVSQCTSQV